MVKDGIKKWKKQIFCIMGSLLMYAAVCVQETGSLLDGGYLERGSYGEDKKTYRILAEGLSEKSVPITVEISPMQYSRQEAELVLEQLYSSLPELILAENETLDHITTDLELTGFFDEAGVKAVWRSKTPDILDSYGHIVAEEIPAQGLWAALDVSLTDGRYKKEGEIELQIYPPYVSAEEAAAIALTEQIKQADLESPANSLVMLPKEYEGRQIRYRDAETSEYWVLPLLGIAMAVLLHGQERVKEEKKKKERQRLLQVDYADVVYQLKVYIGAGLTVRKAWECMVQNYEKEQKRRPGCVRPAYEEMAAALREMKYGMPEGKAISEFGRRCKGQSYLKLSSLLEQNRRTGTYNLTKLLEQEMMAAWEEQKHLAKRMGEEAGTKLLIPLFLMLVVVMVIIMVPALMAMQ